MSPIGTRGHVGSTVHIWISLYVEASRRKASGRAGAGRVGSTPEWGSRGRNRGRLLLVDLPAHTAQGTHHLAPSHRGSLGTWAILAPALREELPRRPVRLRNPARRRRFAELDAAVRKLAPQHHRPDGHRQAGAARRIPDRAGLVGSPVGRDISLGMCRAKNVDIVLDGPNGDPQTWASP